MATKSAAALEEAKALFANEHPESFKAWQKGLVGLSGGTTRNGLYYSPFPFVVEKGEGAYVYSVDGQRYLDIVGEYSAALFGHSHPEITKTIHEAVDNGFALGSVNHFEGKAAELIVSRFPSMEKVRFSNSGSEANLSALNLILQYTGRSKILVFTGAYHGGFASFYKDPKAKTLNAPIDWLRGEYNNIEVTEKLIDDNRDDLAAIFLELAQGPGGCIPAEHAFVRRLREKATEVGAVLMFDEVVTSRSAAGGLQSRIGVIPDMTSLGKYVAGGGLNFGAFGGKREIMDLVDPTNPAGVWHTGTYNNSTLSMSTIVTVLEKVWTPEEAERLWNCGEKLRADLLQVIKDSGANMTVTGVGSVMNIHFTRNEIKSIEDSKDVDPNLGPLLFFDLLRKGILLATRGMICLMTVHTEEEIARIVTAVKEFIEERKSLLILYS